MEKDEYLTQQLITYIGNKRALLNFIGDGIKIVRNELGKDKLKIFDVFSGSGVTARYFRQYSDLLIVNDLEKYSAVINECYLSNQNELDLPALRNEYDNITNQLNKNLKKGIITELYAPQNDMEIQPNERVFSNYNCETFVYNEDSNKLINDLPEVDLAYLDPPYNQHPYGSNYFMLNVILDYKYPQNISAVSGIPDNWKRSDYNKNKKALQALKELVSNIKTKYVLISFNSDGFITIDQMKEMLDKIGKYRILETRYNTFRGSRNLNKRDIHVKEYLYLLEK